MLLIFSTGKYINIDFQMREFLRCEEGCCGDSRVCIKVMLCLIKVSWIRRACLGICQDTVMQCSDTSLGKLTYVNDVSLLCFQGSLCSLHR